MSDPLRVALGVPRVGEDPRANLADAVRMTAEAADAGARLVLFSEAALTGFGALRGEPEHDLPLAEPIPGPATETLAQAAVEHRVWLGLGLFERGAGMLHDSAILLSPHGEIALRYRRIDPHWVHPGADRAVYRRGTSVPTARVDLGTCAFGLCGDLFDEGWARLLRASAPEWLLFPMARGPDEDVTDEHDWRARERHLYARRAEELGVGLLLANQLSGAGGGPDCFGGALAVSERGEVLGEMPPGRQGMLMTEI